jgi:integrin-linked kinase
VIDQQQALRYAIDIARGMAFLHSLEPVILRFYLNSKHVLIDDDLSAKVNMADTKFSFQERGRLYSPAWMAPEGTHFVLVCVHAHVCSIDETRRRDQRARGRHVVVWCATLGNCHTRSATQRTVTDGSWHEGVHRQCVRVHTYAQVALEGLRITAPAGTSKAMARLINICMNEDPGRRPSFDQLLPIIEKMAQ